MCVSQKMAWNKFLGTAFFPVADMYAYENKPFTGGSFCTQPEFKYQKSNEKKNFETDA